ncbi:MAG: hypothetical protein EON47_06225, partial [Acetobacteraceae bacterium]
PRPAPSRPGPCPPAPMSWPAGLAQGGMVQAEVAPVAAPAVAAVVPDAKHPGLVASPMVGVAYLSSEPGQPPFVTLGAKVAQGQTLLLIEAMKTFNQIKAPRAGTVTRILIEPGTPVEYGEPLMIVE